MCYAFFFKVQRKYLSNHSIYLIKYWVHSIYWKDDIIFTNQVFIKSLNNREYNKSCYKFDILLDVCYFQIKVQEGLVHWLSTFKMTPQNKKMNATLKKIIQLNLRILAWAQLEFTFIFDRIVWEKSVLK